MTTRCREFIAAEKQAGGNVAKACDPATIATLLGASDGTTTENGDAISRDCQRSSGR